MRANRDTAVFGLSPDGLYSFGGGTSYSPVAIRSASGAHNINVGDPLPDSLSSFLTASPFSFARSVSPPMFPQDQQLGLTGIRRESYNAFFQDTWKATDRLVITYGLRYEVNTPLREPTGRASGPEFVGFGAGVRQAMLVNLQPTFHTDGSGLGPRAGIEWRVSKHTVWRASGAIVTLLPNIYQTNFITSTNPFELTLFMTAGRGAPLNFQGVAGTFPLPALYAANGQLLFATGRTTDVAPNTEWDLQRFENDLAAITPGHVVHAIAVNGVDTNFRNGYTGAYSTGFDQDLGDVKVTASYVATVGVRLPAISFPNAYGGAEEGFAPYTKFDASGNITGGFGPEQIISNRSHSTYHSLQTGVQKTSPRFGVGFQANYTFSKSLDDASAIVGQLQGLTNGTRQSAAPQDPYSTRSEKGPSTFDVRHVVTASVVQVLPFDRWLPARRWIHAIASGWNAFGVITLTSGSPFTVYSGIQQTGAGSSGGDRPDQVGQPNLSTSHAVGHRLFRAGCRQCLVFFDSYQRRRRHRTEPGTLRNPWPQHLSRTCFSQLRRLPDEGDGLARRNGETAISGGVLQHLQHRQFRVAGEHSDGSRLRNDQSHGRSFPANPVIAQAIVLKWRQSLKFQSRLKGEYRALSRTVPYSWTLKVE